MKTNLIYNTDCIEGMKVLPGESIDLVITDPPYKCNISGAGNMGKTWNTMEWFEDMESHVEWMKECYRVLKDKTHFYCFSSGNALKQLLCDAEEAGFDFKDILVIDKIHNMPVGGYYLRQTEFVLLFSKGIRLINNQKMANIIRLAFPRGKQKKHPTQKPVGLFEMLIRQSTSPGDVVLDPFIGSGTAAIACLAAGRKYIGYEISKDYCNLALREIAESENLFTLANNSQNNDAKPLFAL